MIRTKIAFNYKDIPITWIFEYYLNLSEPLIGQNVTIRSPFNSKDKTPSFKIYYSQSHCSYRFTDFSVGNSGDAFDLVCFKFNESLNKAIERVINDYNKVENYRDYKIEDTNISSSYVVNSYKERSWNTLDANYWGQYFIPSTLLKEYNIRPLSEYTMKCTDNDNTKEFTIKREYVYGYFTNDGELYKIYSPKNLKKKFIIVNNYLQGSEQLKNHRTLIIASSLKDLLCLKILFNNVDFVAPQSENTLIDKHIVKEYLNSYNNIFTLFDKDEAGQLSAAKYLAQYNIDTIYLNLEKDVSDSIVKYGIETVRSCLIPLIKPLLR